MRNIFLLFVLLLTVSVVLVGCGRSAEVRKDQGRSFLVSVDGGANFTPRIKLGEKTIANISVLSMAHSMQNQKTIYIGTRKNGIFVTHDGGSQWQKITFPLENIYGIAVDVSNDQILYASGMRNKLAYVYKSTDGGKNWEKIYTEPKEKVIITALVMDPTQARVLYVGTSAGLIIKTTDGGTSWKNIFVARGPVIDVAFDAQDSKTVYFAIYRRGLLKTRNGGESIEDLTRKMVKTNYSIGNGTRSAKRGYRSSRVYALATDPRIGGIVYVGTDRGIYRSEDYGKTWKNLNVIGSSEKLPVRAIAINPHDTKKMIYGVAHTIYRSSENMTKWTPVHVSVSRRVSVIQYDSSDVNTIYIGMRSGK